MQPEIPPGLLKAWDEDLPEAYEERAAILEFEAGLTQEEAETTALELVNAVHVARLAAKAETQRQRLAEEVIAEQEARRKRIELENAAWAEATRHVWAGGKGKRRRK